MISHQSPIKFIAHIDKETDRQQSVRDHLFGVAVIVSALAERRGLGNIGYLLGILHDSGKLTRAFLQYICLAVYEPEKVSRGKVNHSSAGGMYLYRSFGSSHDKYVKLTSQLLAVVIFSHHGLFDCLDQETGFNKFIDNRMKPELEPGYEEAMANFFAEIMSRDELDRLFYKAVEEIRVFLAEIDMKLMNFTFSQLSRLLLSYLIEGDWTDTSAFINDNNKEAVLNEETDWLAARDFFETKIQRFPTGGKIQALRSVISEDCRQAASRQGGIYRLVVPTGGGKTLASLRYALHHICEHESKRRIFYIIPFLSILEQNAQVIRDYLGKPQLVFEHHSNLVQEASVETGYRDETSKAIYQGWEEPVIITTLVQFMDVLYSGRLSAVRRMHSLSDSVVIIDEVQSVPVKMLALFNLALNFLSQFCGATVVLCSATQPTLDNQHIFKHKRLHLAENANLTGNLEDSFGAFKRVQVVDLSRKLPFTPVMAAEFVMETTGDAANEKLLYVCNTKAQALAIYQELKNINSNDIPLYHLSTNMAPENRRNVLDEIKKLLVRPGKLICITTQLIEAGVDVDFACVVRVVAGLDNAIQAAGRCNRNGIRKEGMVYLLRMADENISKMKEMKIAQTVCLGLLQDFNESPEDYRSDIFSLAAVDSFYARYYSEFPSEQSFDFPLDSTTIYDLLGTNDKAVVACKNKYGLKSRPQLFCQGFATAGRSFKVISDDTTAILVPYKAGTELITSLNGKLRPEALKPLLKQAQRYSVNIYSHMYLQLETRGALYPICEGRVMALKAEFYDEAIGIKVSGGEMDFLGI